MGKDVFDTLRTADDRLPAEQGGAVGLGGVEVGGGDEAWDVDRHGQAFPAGFSA